MKYDKSYLRKKSLIQRKKKYLTANKFNFNLIFKLIREHFYKKKITIAGYYPSNYEVNILSFLEKLSKKSFCAARDCTCPNLELKHDYILVLNNR